MEKIVGLIEGIPQTRSKNDDDFLDRLSSRYSVVIMLVFATVITVHQYVGDVITCWVPVHFTGKYFFLKIRAIEMKFLNGFNQVNVVMSTF